MSTTDPLDPVNLTAEERNRIADANDRYLAAAHAVQSGLAHWMHINPSTFEPKHLRVGIDTSKSDISAIANLMIRKGVFTLVEYHETLADAMEEEKLRWERDLTEKMGASITLA